MNKFRDIQQELGNQINGLHQDIKNLEILIEKHEDVDMNETFTALKHKRESLIQKTNYLDDRLNLLGELLEEWFEKGGTGQVLLTYTDESPPLIEEPDDGHSDDSEDS